MNVKTGYEKNNQHLSESAVWFRNVSLTQKRQVRNTLVLIMEEDEISTISFNFSVFTTLATKMYSLSIQ